MLFADFLGIPQDTWIGIVAILLIVALVLFIFGRR